MAKVRDIMQRDVVTIKQDSTALEAAVLLKDKDISFLVVVDNSGPVGVVTERDFVRKIVADDKQASETSLSDIMSTSFKSVESSTNIEDAVQKMLNHSIRRLVVVDGDVLAGVITQTDLAGFLRSKVLIDGTIESTKS